LSAASDGGAHHRILGRDTDGCGTAGGAFSAVATQVGSSSATARGTAQGLTRSTCYHRSAPDTRRLDHCHADRIESATGEAPRRPVDLLPPPAPGHHADGSTRPDSSAGSGNRAPAACRWWSSRQSAPRAARPGRPRSRRRCIRAGQVVHVVPAGCPARRPPASRTGETVLAIGCSGQTLRPSGSGQAVDGGRVPPAGPHEGGSAVVHSGASRRPDLLRHQGRERPRRRRSGAWWDGVVPTRPPGRDARQRSNRGRSRQQLRPSSALPGWAHFQPESSCAHRRRAEGKPSASYRGARHALERSSVSLVAGQAQARHRRARLREEPGGEKRRPPSRPLSRTGRPGSASSAVTEAAGRGSGAPTRTGSGCSRLRPCLVTNVRPQQNPSGLRAVAVRRHHPDAVLDQAARSRSHTAAVRAEAASVATRAARPPRRDQDQDHGEDRCRVAAFCGCGDRAGLSAVLRDQHALRGRSCAGVAGRVAVAHSPQTRIADHLAGGGSRPSGSARVPARAHASAFFVQQSRCLRLVGKSDATSRTEARDQPLVWDSLYVSTSPARLGETVQYGSRSGS
jgi:hypothetical protein